MTERILLVSPVIPAATGNGLAMRAAMTLRALSRIGNVLLLVHQRYPSPLRQKIAPELASMCEAVVIRQPPAATSPAQEFSGPFDRVHCFRLSTFEAAGPYFGVSPVHIDFDDLESRTHQRIAGVLRLHQRNREAAREEQLAQAALETEIAALAQSDRVYLANQSDIDHLPYCGQAEVRVLPNIIDLPSTSRDDKGSIDPIFPEASQSFTFLFVGTLTYFPNEDAVLFFCHEVLPLIRQQTDRAFRVKLVGLAPRSVMSLANLANVEVTGLVDDVSSHYASADLVIVPLRAGGGTRIKLLEAFAHSVPAVSTALGAEGIDIRSSVECLIADNPASFASACLTAMNDQNLRKRLAERAFHFVQAKHSLAVAITALQ